MLEKISKTKENEKSNFEYEFETKNIFSKFFEKISENFEIFRKNFSKFFEIFRNFSEIISKFLHHFNENIKDCYSNLYFLLHYTTNFEGNYN